MAKNRQSGTRLNRVMLLGHAGREPQIRTMKSGDKTATFSLATTDKWRRQDGETGEATEWHRIVVFGAAVDAAAKLVRKGAALLVEGRITSHEYRDNKGESRRVTEIVVAGPQGRVNVLSPRQDDGRAEDAGEVVGTGDPGGTTGASAPAGEPAGAAPDGPSRVGGQ